MWMCIPKKHGYEVEGLGNGGGARFKLESGKSENVNL